MSLELEALAGRLRTLAAERFQREIRAELIATGLRAEAQARQLVSARLRVRTGRLRNSIASRVEVNTDGAELHLTAGGRGVPYARIQEEGGLITPRRGKYLAIPTGPALTGAGVARYASPRQVPGLRFQRARSGNGLLVKDGPNGRMEVWYFLVRQSKITGKRFMSDGMNQARAGLGSRLATRIVSRILEGTRGL